MSFIYKKANATVLLCIHSRGVSPVLVTSHKYIDLPKLLKNVITSISLTQGPHVHVHRVTMCI